MKTKGIHCFILISYSQAPHSRRLFKLYCLSFPLSLHLSNIISVIRSSFFQNKAGWRACLALLSGTLSAKGPPSGPSLNDIRMIVACLPPFIVYLWNLSMLLSTYGVALLPPASSADVIYGWSKRGPSPSFMPHQVGKRGCLCLAITLKLQPL